MMKHGILLVLPKVKNLFIKCCSFCMMFDHLIQRDPAQLTFFRLCGLIDPYVTLLANPSQCLTQYWDCLEVIRLITSDLCSKTVFVKFHKKCFISRFMEHIKCDLLLKLFIFIICSCTISRIV